MTARRGLRRGVGAAALAAVLVAGCWRASAAPPAVEVLDAYTIPGEGSLAVYLTLGNAGGDDAIVGARLRDGAAPRVERITLHRTVERDGRTTMRPAERLEVPGGSATALGPGGGHLMLEGMTSPVALGDSLELTVELDRSGPVDVTVTVVTADEALARLREEDEP